MIFYSLDDFSTKEELLAAIAAEQSQGLNERTGPIQAEICQEFRRLIEGSWDFPMCNTLREGFGPGDTWWDSEDEIEETFLDYVDNVATREYGGERTETLMSIVRPQAKSYIQDQLSELIEAAPGDRFMSNISYGRRRGAYEDAIPVGTCACAYSFEVPDELRLGFEFSSEREARAYVELVQSLCSDLTGWALDLDLLPDYPRFYLSMEPIDDDDNEIVLAVPREEVILELLQDWRFVALMQDIEKDPQPAIDYLFAELERIAPEAHAKLRKAKFPKSALKSYAAAFLQMDENQYDDGERVEFIREAMGMLGYEGSDAEVLLEINREKLEELGVTRGKWLDNAPWRLVSLPPVELAYEGTVLRHCVGRFDMGYRERVERGEIWIWSLRDRYNRPRLTWEVNVEEWEDADRRAGQASMLRFTRPGSHPGDWDFRAAAIRQLKGFSNRYAGLGKDEQKVLEYIFGELMVNAEQVRDYRRRDKNPSEVDCPW